MQLETELNEVKYDGERLREEMESTKHALISSEQRVVELQIDLKESRANSARLASEVRHPCC